MKLVDKGPLAPPPTLAGPAEKVAREVRSWTGIVCATHWYLLDRRGPPLSPPCGGKGGSPGEPLGKASPRASRRPSAGTDGGWHGRRLAPTADGTDSGRLAARRERDPSGREAGSAPPLAAARGGQGGPAAVEPLSRAL